MKCMNNLRAATMMRTAVVKDVAGILSDASARVRQDHAAVLGQRVQQGRLVQLLRQYMHNTEIAVTMRLSTILKTIKQPL